MITFLFDNIWTFAALPKSLFARSISNSSQPSSKLNSVSSLHSQLWRLYWFFRYYKQHLDVSNLYSCNNLIAKLLYLTKDTIASCIKFNVHIMYIPQAWYYHIAGKFVGGKVWRIWWIICDLQNKNHSN